MRQGNWARAIAFCIFSLTFLVSLAGCGGTGGTAGPPPVVRVTLGSAGGNVVDGNATLTVAGSSLTQATQFSVQPTTQYPADARLLPGTAYTFSSTATTFAANVRVSLRYNGAALKGNQVEASVRLFQVVGGVWTQVSGSSADINTKTVTGTTTTLGTFAVLVTVGS